jgi:hypothetical protein
MTNWPDDGTRTVRKAADLESLLRAYTDAAVAAIPPAVGATLFPRVTQVTTASDLTTASNGAISSGSPTLTGTFRAANADAGKLIVVIGAGPSVTVADGAMSLAVSRDRNILTSATANFTSAMIGQKITVTGVGASGATMTSRIWGVISSTQVRLMANCATTASAQTVVISADLHAAITASTLTTATLDANASTTIASGGTYWYGTDDAPAVQAAITAAEALAGSGNGYTILVSGQMAWGSTVRMTKPGVLQGTGADGYTQTIGRGTTRVKAMRANMTCFQYGSNTVGMGVNGGVTAAGTVLTDPRGQFTAGDIGKTIHIIGAGAQTGSSTLISHTTTIAAPFISATQVNLTAAAVTTVVDGTYVYFTSSTGGLQGITIRSMHFEGFAASMCGIHIINLSDFTLDHVTCSDFYSGIGFFLTGPTSFSSGCHINDSAFADCFRCVVAYKSALIFNGTIMVDGNSNNVGVVPGPGTIGVQAYGEIIAPGFLGVQACDTGVWHDGIAGRIHLSALRIECCPNGLVMNADATNGGIGSVVSVTSWSNGSIGPASCKGIVMGASVRNTVLMPGQVATDGTDMYGSCDATSLGLSWVIDPARGAVRRPTTQAANYILALTDNGTTLQCTKATAQSVTLPTNSVIPMPIGSVIDIVQYGAGQVTISPGAGVTCQKPTGKALTTRVQFSLVRVTKIAADEWIASGDLT